MRVAAKTGWSRTTLGVAVAMGFRPERCVLEMVEGVVADAEEREADSLSSRVREESGDVPN